ncbi:MAG: hypothetical protein AAGA92_08635 [Planctomycetota bacterium]
MNLSPLEELLGRPVPTAIVSLYSQLDPVGNTLDVMRLLTVAEAVQATLDIRAFYTDLSTELLFLWTDDNSNYAGVYTAGDLAPRVAILDHEEPDATPAFFGIESFRSTRQLAAQEGLSWYEFSTDYPVRVEEDYPLAQADIALGVQYLKRYQDQPENNRSLAFYALNLLPTSHMGMTRDLLFSKDMWVQERACEVVGMRQHAPAIDDLESVAREGLHNGRIAAIIALESIGTTEANAKLRTLSRELGPNYLPYFR